MINSFSFSPPHKNRLPEGVWKHIISLHDFEKEAKAMYQKPFPVIDMIETAENVWSDACVCAMVDHDLKGKLSDDGEIPAAL